MQVSKTTEFFAYLALKLESVYRSASSIINISRAFKAFLKSELDDINDCNLPGVAIITVALKLDLLCKINNQCII